MRVGSLEIQIMAGIARLQKDMNDAQRIVGGSMANVEKSVASAKRAMQTLGIGLPLAMITDQVRRMTDQYTKLDAQLRLSTKSQAQYAQGMSDIRRISTVAQADLSATSMLYTRLMNVMQGTGIEQSKLATVTETVSFGLKAYGATAQEASSAALQLSQAMGANRLGGEEFRAVMEAMPNVMKVLADSMGVPLGALRQLSIDGKITADEMVKAFGDPTIAAKFKALAENAQTITGAWVVARNELTLLVGEFMKSSGVTGGMIAGFNALGAVFRFLADNLGTLLNAFYAYIAVVGTKLVAGLVQARMAQMALNAAHGEALAVNLTIAQSEAANALAAREVAAARAFQLNGTVALNAAQVEAVAINAALAKSELDAAVATRAASVAEIAQATTRAKATFNTEALIVANAGLAASDARLAAAELAVTQSERAGVAAAAELAAARVAAAAATNAQTAANARLAASAGQLAAAEKLQAAGTIGLAGRIKGAVGKAGWIGMALFGIWSVVDFLDGMQAISDGAKKTAADLAGLSLQQVMLMRQKQLIDVLNMKGAIMGAERYRVEIRDGEAAIKVLDDQIAKLVELDKAQRAKSETGVKLTHDEGVVQQRMIELAAQFSDGKLKEAEYIKRVNEELYGTSAALKEHNKELKAEAKERAALNDLLEASAKYQQDNIDGINAETEALLKKIEQERFDTEAIGKTKEQLALLQAVRYDNITALQEQKVAALEASYGDEAEIAAIKEQVKARKELKRVWGDQATAQAAEAQGETWKEMWDSIDKTAHDTFVSIMNGGKDTATRLKEAFKNGFFDWLYSMTVKKWIVNVSGVMAGGVAGAAGAATGGYGGGTGLMDIASSGIGVAMSGLTASQALSAASAYGSAALSATSLAEGISMATSGLSLAMPYIGAAIAVYSLLSKSKGTPTRNLGNAAAQFSATGAMTGQQTFYGGSSAGVDAQIASMQSGYMKAAMALGIGTAATQFSFGANTGKNSQSPNFALGGGVVGQAGFYQAETAMSDAAVQLAASRAIFAALQGSDLPTYLANMFNGLTAGAMTQQDIDNTLAFAGSVKQMREALLETRAPLEILRANVNAGTTAFATSAATFRTDFVAAIDAGINPQMFEQWRALGSAIDQLAASDAQLAAENLANVNGQIKKLQDVALSNFEAARKATDSLRAFALSVRELQRSLWAGAQTPLSSTYSVTRSQFAAINASAGANDPNAQGNLANAATAFLDASKLRSVSAIEYARDFAFVQNSLDTTATLTEDAVTVADQQLIQLQQANTWLAALDSKSATQTQSLSYLLMSAIASSEAAAKATADQTVQVQAEQAVMQAQAQAQAQAFAQQSIAQAQAQTVPPPASVVSYSASNPNPANVAAKAAALLAMEAANEAVANYEGRGRPRWLMNAAVEATAAYNALPAFAVGTNALTSDGPIYAHAGEEVKPKAYVDADKAERAETNTLLREMRKELSLIKSTNYRMLLIEDKWDNEGTPEVREAA